MRHYNQTSYQTLPRTGSGHRSRSQNHYYIQANEFEKRYQNSLINAYKLNTSRKCPPCCGQRGYETGMGYGDYEKENLVNRSGQELSTDYYETSYFNQQKTTQNHYAQNEQLITNLQKSKKYLQELIQKSNTNYRLQNQKCQQQILTLQNLVSSKTQQIQQLTKQIYRLKKISLQTTPSGINMSYIKQDQGNLIQIQNKEKQLKDLQRKLARYREENSYFREDIEIKNKEIQQLKDKFNLKESNDLNARKQLQKEIDQIKQEKRLLMQKTIWLEKAYQDKQIQHSKQRQLKERQKQKTKRFQSQLQSMKIKYLQAKSSNDHLQSHFTNQYTILQTKFITQYSTLETQFKSVKQLSRQKDMQIQGLMSKINCIQAELDFFKDKFTNLLMEIQREERQSAIMYDHAATLKQEGIKFYETTQRLRQSELIQLQSQPRTSRLYGFNNMLQGTTDNFRMAQSIKLNNRVGLGRESLGLAKESIGLAKESIGLGKESVFQSLSPRHFNREFDLMAQSNVQFVHRLPSLNMSISPIRTRD